MVAEQYILSADSLFIGRTQEQQLWQNTLTHLLSSKGAKEHASHLFLLSGDGGMGKSLLARRFCTLAMTQAPWQGRFQLLWIDWGDEAKRHGLSRSSLDINDFFQIIREAAGRNQWSRQFQAYNRLIKERAVATQKISTLVETHQDDDFDEVGAFRSLAVEMIFRILRTKIPSMSHEAEGLLKILAHAGISVGWEQAKRLREKLETIFRTHFTDQQLEAFFQADQQSAQAIARGLQNVAKQKRLIIVFDGYETADQHDLWTRALIQEGGANITWLIAGRNDLWRSRQFGDSFFVGYEQALPHHAHHLPMTQLTSQETADYLARSQDGRVVSPQELTQLHQATHGVPLAVQQAAEILGSGGKVEEIVQAVQSADTPHQIVQELTENYLRHVVVEADKALLYALALADGDVPLLRALVEPLLEKRPLEERLQQLERHYASVHAYRARLHDEPSAFLVNYLRSDLLRTSDTVRDLNSRALAFLNKRQQRLLRQLPLIEQQCADGDYIQNTQQIAKHTFWQDTRQGWQYLLPRYLDGWVFSENLRLGLLEVVSQWREQFTPQDKEVYRLLSDGGEPNALATKRQQLWQWLQHRLLQAEWLGEPLSAERQAVLALRGAQIELAQHQTTVAATMLHEATPLIPAQSTTLARLYKELGAALPRPATQEAVTLLSMVATPSTPTTIELGVTLTLPATPIPPIEEAPLTTTPPTSESTPELTTDWYQIGLQELQKGSWVAAQNAFVSAVHLQPQHAPSYLQLGHCYQHLRHFDEAERAYQQAAFLADDWSEPHLALALLASQQEQVQSAENHLIQALRRDPDSVPALTSLGDLFLHQEKSDHALKAYRQVLLLDENHPPALYGMAMILRQQQRLPESAEFLRRAHQAEPDQLTYIADLSLILAQQENWEEALPLLQQIVNSPLSTAEHQRALAQYLWQNGETQEALAHSQQALQCQTDHLPSLLQAANFAFDQQEYATARAHYDRAQALGINGSLPLLRYGEACWQVGDLPAAQNAFRQAITRSAEPSTAQFRLAQLYLQTNRSHHALPLLRQLVEETPTHLEARLAYSQILLEMGRSVASLRQLQRALEYAPQNSDVRLRLAELYTKTGDSQAAQAEYEQIVQLHPTHALAQVGLAQLCEQQGRGEEAQNHFSQALSADPHNITALWGMAQCLQRKGQATAARQHYAQLRHSQYAPQAHIALGQIACHEADWLAAYELFEEAEQLGAQSELPYAQWAESALRVGQPERAIFLAQIAIDHRQESAELYTTLGQAYQQRGNAPEAERAFLEAIADKPNHVAAWVGLGELARQQANWEQARQHYETALQHHPDNAPALAGLGATFVQLGEKSRAHALYCQAWELDPTNVVALLGLAEDHLEQGHSQSAIQGIKQAIAYQPKNGVAWQKLGYLLLEKGETEEAAHALRRALELEATSAETYTAYADALSQLHPAQVDQPLQLYHSAHACQPNYAPALVGMGRCYLAQNRPDLALSAYEKASQYGFHPFPYRDLGQAYWQQGQNSSAISALQLATQADPKDGRVWELLGHAYIASGATEQAEAAYRQALGFGVESADLHAHFAQLYRQKGDHSAEITALERALKLDDRQLHVWQRVAECYAQAGHFGLARQAYHQLLQRDPQHVPALCGLSEIALARQEYDRVQMWLTQAKTLAPADGRVQELWGRLWDVSADPQTALQAYQRATELDPNLPLSWLGQARALRQLGQVDKAIAAYDEAEKQLSADHPFPYSERAELLLQQGRADEAGRDFAQEAERAALSSTLLGGWGRALHQQNLLAPARQKIEAATALEPNNAQLWDELGRICLALEDLPSARQAAQRAVELAPLPSAYLTLAQLYERAEEYDRALWAYQRADPSSPQVQLNIARLAQQLGRRSEAGRALQEATRLGQATPQSAEWHQQRAELWLKQGEDEQALSAYQMVVQLQPTHRPAYTQLGYLLLNQGKLGEAQTALEQAVQDEQSEKEARRSLAGLYAQQKEWVRALPLYVSLQEQGERLSADERQALAEGYLATAQWPLAQTLLTELVAERPNHYAPYWGLGRACRALGQIDQAIAAFCWAQQRDPSAHEVYLPLGELYADHDQPHEALKMLHKAAQFDADNALIYVHLGKLYHQIGRADDALDAYRHALTLEPTSLPAWRGLGELQLSQEDGAASAQEAFAHALHCDKGDAASWWGLGRAHAYLGQANEALTAYQQALRLGYQAAELYHELGSTYQKLGNQEAAVIAFREAVMRDGQDVEARLSLGWAELAANRPNKALELFDSLCQQSAEQQEEAWCGLGAAYLALDQVQPAEQAYLTALEQAPQSALAQRGLANLYRKANRSQEAVKHYQLALLQNPYSQKTRLELADCYAEMGLCREALEQYSLILTEDESNLSAVLGAAQMANELRQPLAALSYLERVPEAQREDPTYCLLAGEVAWMQYRTEEAISWLQKAQEVNPRDPHVLTSLGMAFLQAEDPKSAETYFKRAIERLPHYGPAHRGIGECKLALGESQDALTHFGRAQRYEPTSPTSIVSEGMAALTLHRWDDANLAFKRALQIDPAYAPAYAGLGFVAHACLDNPLAEQYFRHATQLSPYLPLAWAGLGDLDKERGFVSGAIEAYERAVALRPKDTQSRASLVGLYNQIGDNEGMGRHYAIASAEMVNQPPYNRACFEVLCGNLEEGMRFLREAIEQRRVDWAQLERDPDLEPLRAKEEYTKLLAKYGPQGGGRRL